MFVNFEQTGSGNERILVVEDEAMLRTLVEGVLQHHGYTVCSAASGEEATALWRKQNGKFDLLLTDMMLPDGVTGHQIAQQLRIEHPALKVIYASGFSNDAIQGGGEPELTEGVNFLQKPFSTESLVQTIRDCLSISMAGEA